VGRFWKGLGKGVGKGIAWLFRNPQMVEVIIDTIVKSKMEQEQPKDPPPSDK